MKILTSTNDLTISMNVEQDFKTDLGWEEGALQMEEQILSEIINPIENYETVRYIHKPYTSSLGVEQTDIWFSFYFLNGSTYVNDYEPTGLSNKENALMLKQTVKSFFRLEFFKTPNGVKPDRTNRKLVFAKNLSLPLGEKYFHTTLNDYIFLPVFMGSNYRNKENMYLFWFQDESPFSGTTITGNTFWMTAKFYNAEDGSISDFVNKPNLTDIVYDGRVGKSENPIKFYEKNSVSGYTEYEDLYYKVTIDKSDYSYMVERDVQNDITLTPTPTPTPTPTTGGAGVTNTPTPTPTSVTPTPTPTGPTPTPTPTPTEPTIYTLQLGYDASERLTACSNYTNSNTTTVYSYTQLASIGQGTVLYTGFTYPLTGYAPNGWYSNGDNGWIVYGGGSLNNETSCSITPTPTPTPTPLPGIAYLVMTGLTFNTTTEACSQYESNAGISGTTLFLNDITSPSTGNQFYTSQGCELGTEYSGSGMNDYYFVYRLNTKRAMQIGVGGTITQIYNCSS